VQLVNLGNAKKRKTESRMTLPGLRQELNDKLTIEKRIEPQAQRKVEMTNKAG